MRMAFRNYDEKMMETWLHYRIILPAHMPRLKNLQREYTEQQEGAGRKMAEAVERFNEGNSRMPKRTLVLRMNCTRWAMNISAEIRIEHLKNRYIWVEHEVEP